MHHDNDLCGPMHQAPGSKVLMHQLTNNKCLCTTVTVHHSYPIVVKAPHRRKWMDGSLGSNSVLEHTHADIWQSAGVTAVRNSSPRKAGGAPSAVYGPIAGLAWGY